MLPERRRGPEEDFAGRPSEYQEGDSIRKQGGTPRRPVSCQEQCRQEGVSFSKNDIFREYLEFDTRAETALGILAPKLIEFLMSR